MDVAKLDEAINRIRVYTKQHPELLVAHHFTYDLPIPSLQDDDRPRYIILGINPGETEYDRRLKEGPTEETRHYDFHTAAQAQISPAAKKWRNISKEIVSGQPCVFSDLFFWSAAGDKETKERYGDIFKSKHMSFCVEMLTVLIESYQPKGVVIAGLGVSLKLAKVFELDHVRSYKPQEFRLVEHYSDGIRPWFFTKHFSASRKFTKEQREDIREYIASQADRASRFTWTAGQIEISPKNSSDPSGA